MKRLLITISAVWFFPRLAQAHGGHWHLDEETLAKIFGAADAVYQWFAIHAVTIATVIVAVLTVWGIIWLRQQSRAKS